MFLKMACQSSKWWPKQFFWCTTKTSYRDYVPELDWKGIPHSCSSCRERAVTACWSGRWTDDQCWRRRRPETLACLDLAGQSKRLYKVWRRSAVNAAMCRGHITGTWSIPELLASGVHGEATSRVLSSPRSCFHFRKLAHVRGRQRQSADNQEEDFIIIFFFPVSSWILLNELEEIFLEDKMLLKVTESPAWALVDRAQC